MKNVEVVDIVKTLMANTRSMYLPSRTNRTYMRDAVVLELIPIEGIPFHLVILTAYDEKGLKSARAVPLSHFLEAVSRLESTLGVVSQHLQLDQGTRMAFENQLYGHGAKGDLKAFLGYTNSHRFAFVRDDLIGVLARDFNTENNRTIWSDMGLNVLVTHYS